MRRHFCAWLFMSLVSLLASCGSDSGTPQPPSKLTDKPDLAVAEQNQSLVLSWTLVSGATGYEVYVNQTADASDPPYKIVHAQAASYIVSGLVNGQNYYVKVRAFGGNNNFSPFSDELLVTPHPDIPTIPSGFAAQLSNDATQLNLQWTVDPSVDSYILWVTPSNGVRILVAQDIIDGLGSYSYPVTPGISYTFELLAVNTAGKSAPATVNYSAPNTPDAPTGLSVVAVSGTEVNIQWTADASVSGYKLYQSLDNGGSYQTLSETIPSSQSVYPSAVVPGQNYTYKLLAYNVSGDSAAAITSYSAPAVPGTPVNFKAVGDSYDATLVHLTWNAIAGVSYSLSRINADQTTTTLNSNINDGLGRYDDTVLLGKSYIYQLSANNIAGTSAQAVANYTSPSLPLAVTDLVATFSTPTSVTLSWTQNDASVNLYRLYRSEVIGGVVGKAQPVNENITPPGLKQTFSVTDTVVTGSSYEYTLFATNIAGDVQVASVNYSALNYPAIPVDFKASFTNATSATLTWTQNDGTVQLYKLYRTPKNGTQQVINAAIAATGINTTYSIADTVSKGVEYTYTLLASSSVGDSPPVNVVYVAPNDPQTPVDFNVVFVSGTSANVTWTQNDSGVSTYKLSRSYGTTTEIIDNAIVASGLDNTYSIPSTVVKGTQYTYSLIASNILGDSLAVDFVYSAPSDPQTPIDFAVTVVTGTSLNLTWTQNDASITGYKLYRTPAGAAEEIVNDAIPSTGLNTSYSIPDTVVLNTNYTYSLIASNVVGDSLRLNLDYVPPPIPGSPILDVPTTLSDASVTISWTEADSNAAGYVISRSDTGANSFTVLDNAVAAGTGTVSYTDNMVVGGNSYDYEVYAFNISGNSAVVGLTYVSPIKPLAPTNVTFGFLSTPAVYLSWVSDAANITHFVLSRDDAAGGGTVVFPDINALDRVYTDSTVIAGASYNFRLIAYNGVVASDPVWVNNVTVPGAVTAPIAPGNLAVSGEVTSVGVPLTWLDNSNNEDNFLVQRKDVSLGVVDTFTTIATLTPDTTSFVDQSDPNAGTNMQPGTHYEYQVVAANSAGQAPTNIIATIVPPKDSNSFLAFTNKTAPRFVENAQTAAAYYAAIDPGNLKDTATKWKDANGFGAGSTFQEAVYVNDADLGFARRMYVNPDVNGTGNVASYVENYATLADAIGGNQNNIIATVAMEYTQPALTAAEVAAKKEVLASSSQSSTVVNTNYTSTVIGLSPGNYDLVVGANTSFASTSHPFAVTVSESGGGATLLGPLTNQYWTILPFEGALYAYYVPGLDGDFSGEHYTFNVAAGSTGNVDINLQTDVPASVALRKIYQLVGQSSATATAPAQVTATLDPGEYVIVVGTASYFDLASVGGGNAFTINVSGTTIATLADGSDAAALQVITGGAYGSGVNEQPENPRNYEYRIYVTGTTQSVTIDMVVPNTLILPMIALLQSDSGVAPSNPVIRDIPGFTGSNNLYPYTLTDGSPNPAVYDSSHVKATLPPGDYEAVVSYYPFDLNLGFTFNFLDPSIICSNGAPTSILTDGPNAFFLTNPRCNFTLTQSTDVDLTVTQAITGTDIPLVTILGYPGDFRNVVAYGETDYTLDFPSAELHTTLAEGNYQIVAGSRNFRDQGEVRLLVDVNATNTIDKTMLWTASAYSSGSSLSARPEFITPLSIGPGGAAVDMSLAATQPGLAQNGALVYPQPIIYVIDSTGKVVDQAQNRRNQISTVDVDLLPGDYKLVVAAGDGSGFEVPRYRMSYTINNQAPVTVVGDGSGLDNENPYSPNASQVTFPKITAPSHVSLELKTTAPAVFYLIGNGDKKIVTFYTYIGAKGAAGNANLTAGQRVLSANLDGRGEKFQPGVCNVCHGGAPKSLDATGAYPDHGDTNAGFLAWDMDLFKYDETGSSQYTRAFLDPIMKEFNRTVLAVQRDPVTNTTNKNGTAINDLQITARNELIYGWYGGPTLPNAFNGSYVPLAWRPGTVGTRFDYNINSASTPEEIAFYQYVVPAGADTLYLDVVKPTCRLCHLQRGTVTDPRRTEHQAPITFRKYRDFADFKEEIEDLVYDRAKMPLALRTFDHFWTHGQADKLAQGLGLETPFERYDAAGNVLTPGRPIAIAQFPATLPAEIAGSQTIYTKPDLTWYVPTNNLVTLNGNASEFHDGGFKWRIFSQPAGSTLTLASPNSATPGFTPVVPGNYRIELIVNNGSIDSAPAYIDVNAQSAFTAISFANDLVPNFIRADRVWESYPQTGTDPFIYKMFGACMRCHSKREEYPLYNGVGNYIFNPRFNSSTFLWSPLSGTPNEIYNNLLDRIDLNNPLESRLLNPGSSTHHLNHVQYNDGWGYNATGGYPFDSTGNVIDNVDWRNFNMMLQWILQGAQNN